VVENIEKVCREHHLDSLGNVRRFSEAHVHIPETETGQGAIPPVVGVRGDQDLAEVLNCGCRILKVVKTRARERGCACWVQRLAITSVSARTGIVRPCAHASVRAAIERTNRHSRQHPRGDAEV
jgi:hypothetical protein